MVALEAATQMFFKTDVLKNFEIFTRKRLCWSVFLIKLQALRPAHVLKRDSKTGAFVNIAKFLRTACFVEYLRWLLLVAFR